LAKNPENRYQTAAEMRTDLVRVHNGETPEAPKVFTDAERTSLLAATGPGVTSPRSDPLPRQNLDRIDRDDTGGSVGRWVVAVAVLAVLTIVVVIAFNTFGGGTRDVQVPDMRGQVSADAIATLQNRGFKTRTLQKPDSSIPPDHVISTDPGANASVGAGDEITINVSTGPEQREVPDVSSLSYSDAVTKLKAAGFSKFKQANSPSTPELLGKVIGTNPPANQTSAITNVITVVVGSGPETKQIPDVAGQNVDLAQKNLTVYGFTKLTQTQVDSTRPAGEVIGTNPPKGQTVPVDSIVEVQVSKGNQFPMPDLTGMFWTDAEPRLRALGWMGVLDKGADVDAGGSQHNKIVYQNPPAGTGVSRDGIITLKFGQ
jgi:beta-lactam-binding protein with PASTA domain